MRRTYFFLSLIGAVVVLVLLVWRSTPGGPQPADAGPAANERRLGKTLPLGQVILFNSGVGYFQREGVIEGDARVDLQFPASDVNDLLKSLVLQDLDHGKVTTISYDGQEPIDRTLKSFSLDLTGNPTCWFSGSRIRWKGGIGSIDPISVVVKVIFRDGMTGHHAERPFHS
jgi:hypothetical protein